MNSPTIFPNLKVSLSTEDVTTFETRITMQVELSAPTVNLETITRKFQDLVNTIKENI